MAIRFVAVIVDSEFCTKREQNDVSFRANIMIIIHLITCLNKENFKYITIFAALFVFLISFSFSFGPSVRNAIMFAVIQFEAR